MEVPPPPGQKPARRARGRPPAGQAGSVAGAVAPIAPAGATDAAAATTCAAVAPRARPQPRAVYCTSDAGSPFTDAAPVAVEPDAAPQQQAAAQQPPTMSDDENVILKLSFSDSPHRQPPDPYDEAAAEAFTSHPCSVPEEVGVAMGDTAAHLLMPSPNGNASSSAAPSAPSAPPNLRLVKLLTEFEEKSKTGEWPLSTSVHCYWCCHKFGNTPFGMPVKYAHERFHVIGCFCSLECTAAYNFATRDSLDECLHRYSLINSLAYRMGVGLGRVVRPAPSRLALSIFGGHMGIDEFRMFTLSARHVIVNSPPMIAVTQQVEEVNDTDLRSEYKYVPLDQERVVRFQEKIRLKRSKPVVNFKNTLDHAMRVKIVSSSPLPCGTG